MKKSEEKVLTTFEKLSAINVNAKAEKKNNLTYLSWAWAWSEVKKVCPNATYQMGETEYDETLGFMCHSSVTIDGETLSMWLPVMDGANKSMMREAYSYTTRYGEKQVAGATMFDLNKTMMRCLVKNLAMFGMGIYIYAGEDMPESNNNNVVEAQEKAKATSVQNKKAPKLNLKKGDDNWDNVMSYVKENKSLGNEKLTAMVGRKYAISIPVQKELSDILNS
jgi:hypothetical protein|tara:strand:- start:1994 stop:2659 length:666 start_codon:yes stop_codon:yes gene_type:complete